jgi:hypothetical protein
MRSLVCIVGSYHRVFDVLPDMVCRYVCMY